jgi:acetoacetate decarboxylase
MTYPPAPWTLQGFAVQTLRLVDTAKARPFIPPDLDIVPVLPGKTLGLMYLASHAPGSALSYNELIVVPALVRYGKNVGFWISHIYVDHPGSMAGGREIWGLPKELAQFDWRMGEESEVRVGQGERILCRLCYRRPLQLWRQPLFLPVLSELGGSLLRFKGSLNARLGLGKGRMIIPDDSPFAGIGLAGASCTYHYDSMAMVAHAPWIIRCADNVSQERPSLRS